MYILFIFALLLIGRLPVQRQAERHGQLQAGGVRARIYIYIHIYIYIYVYTYVYLYMYSYIIVDCIPLRRGSAAVLQQRRASRSRSSSARLFAHPLTPRCSRYYSSCTGFAIISTTYVSNNHKTPLIVQLHMQSCRLSQARF